MTRFLCVGDLHLGAGPDYGRQPGDRLADQERVWERALGLAVDQDVDAVLFAGDAFHRRRPTPAELMAFQRPLQRFNAEHDIEVLAINGNHDVEAGDLPSALELFARELDLHTEPGLWHSLGRHEIATPGGVTVCTLPWTPVSRLVATRGGGDRDDNHQLAAQLLVEIAREQRAQVSGPAVLMLHWSVSGASTPTGVMTDEFREVVLPAAELERLGYDAIVCGHIHSGQELAPAFFYTGSPAPVDFGEARDRHGVWLLNVGEGSPELEFLPIESRPFLTIDLDGAQMQMLPGTQWQDVADAVVRVRYRATEEQARRVDHTAITRALYDAGAHRVYAIQPDIVRENRARVDGVDEDLAPLAALELWLDANGIGREALDEPVELAQPSLDQADQLRALTTSYLEEGIAA